MIDLVKLQEKLKKYFKIFQIYSNFIGQIVLKYLTKFEKQDSFISDSGKLQNEKYKIKQGKLKILKGASWKELYKFA